MKIERDQEPVNVHRLRWEIVYKNHGSELVERFVGCSPSASQYCVPQKFVATSIDHGEARVQCEDMEGSGAWSSEDDA